jgi:hypothetical protein
MLKSAIVFSLCVSAAACSGASGSSTSSGSVSGSSGDDAGASDATAATDSPTAPTLTAPMLDSVEKMHGGLHVMWTNMQKGCDAIELERKLDTDFKLIFTIPDGTVDNKHDGTVTAGKVYAYRLRCKKGDTYSAYSNEMTGTP